MEERKAIGFYDYTVVLTYCGMLFAFIGVMQVVNGNFGMAMLCLMFAGICDIFDGAVASTKNRSKEEKQFGVQIDSLSDLISFCVLPGIFVYSVAGQKRVVGIVVALYVLSGLIRLAYYNVLEESRSSRSSEGEPAEEKMYHGFPVTSAALLLPLVYLLYEFGVIHNLYWFVCALIVMGVGFLTPIRIKNPNLVAKTIFALIGLAEMAVLIMDLTWGIV